MRAATCFPARVAPALVTEDDVMEYDLDNRPIEQRGRNMYAERPIHGSIYRAREDVNAVCHSHARQITPFTVTRGPIRPVWVMGATIGDEVPIWDIREDFRNDDGMLVVNDAIGSSLAKWLGAGRACLLAGHGAVIAEASIKRTVLVAISLVTNAELLMQSRLLALTQDDRRIRYLTTGEAAATAESTFNPRVLERIWEYWAGCASGPTR